MDFTQLLEQLNDVDEIRRKFKCANPKGRVKLEEFVALMKSLLKEVITDDMTFVMQAIDAFRRMDLQGTGTVGFKEFREHIMHLDVLADEGVLRKMFRYKRRRDAIPDLKAPVCHMSYYPRPVDRIVLYTENSDVVRLFMPPLKEGDVPRPSIALTHFTDMGRLQVLACCSLGDDHGMVTSTRDRDGEGYYLNCWELPRSSDGDKVHAAMLKDRVRVVSAQTVIYRASNGLVLTGGPSADCIQVWAVINHKLRAVRTMKVHNKPVTCMVELRWLNSSSKPVVVSGGMDGSLCVLDLNRLALDTGLAPSASVLQQVPAHEFGVYTLAQSKKHKLMFSVGVFEKSTISRIHMWTKRLATVNDSSAAVGIAHSKQRVGAHTHQVVDLKVIEEEDQLVSADVAGEVRVWNIVHNEEPQILNSKSYDRLVNPLRAIMVLGPCPYTLALPHTIFVAGNNVVEMWQKARVRNHDSVFAAFYNLRFKSFMVLGAKSIYVWDGQGGALKKTYDVAGILGDRGKVTACCIGDEENEFILGDDKGQIHVCSYTFGARLKFLDPHQGVVTSLSYMMGDKIVISTSSDGRIRFLDDRDPTGYIAEDMAKGMVGRSVILKEITYSTALPNQRMPRIEILTAASDEVMNYLATVSLSSAEIADVNVWDYETAALVGSVLEPQGRDGSTFAATALTVCPSYPLIAAGTEMGVVHLWKVPSLEYAQTLTHRRPSSAATMSGVDRMTMTAGISAMVTRNDRGLWVYAGDEMGFLTAWFLDEYSVQVMIEGEEDEDDDDFGGPITWNYYRKKYSRRWQPNVRYDAYRVTRLRVNLDKIFTARRLAGHHQEVNHTTAENTVASKHWMAHEDRVLTLAFITEPASLVSCGADNMVYIWDAQNGGSKLGALDVRDAAANLNSWKFIAEEEFDTQAVLDFKESMTLLRKMQVPKKVVPIRRKIELKSKFKAVKLALRTRQRRAAVSAIEKLRKDVLMDVQGKRPLKRGPPQRSRSSKTPPRTPASARKHSPKSKHRNNNHSKNSSPRSDAEDNTPRKATTPRTDKQSGKHKGDGRELKKSSSCTPNGVIGWSDIVNAACESESLLAQSERDARESRRKKSANKRPSMKAKLVPLASRPASALRDDGGSARAHTPRPATTDPTPPTDTHTATTTTAAAARRWGDGVGANNREDEGEEGGGDVGVDMRRFDHDYRDHLKGQQRAVSAVAIRARAAARRHKEDAEKNRVRNTDTLTSVLNRLMHLRSGSELKAVVAPHK